ncbi:MAG TPA: glycosyl hydrolase family 18 protein [Candidatus Paceibacterota bacterium]|nr:glycosyl hydrolase family 18 protein [Candidatus Paceibacterota bacterium]
MASLFPRIATTALIAAVVFMNFAPLTHAAPFEVSGWIPYWQAKKGAADARKNIKAFTELNPFTYSVLSTGAIRDNADMKASYWKSLVRAADKNNVAIVPTLMWSDGNAIHRTLSNPQLRAAHIKEIVKLVEDGKYDGIDIDYEGKLAETKDYFSLFLTELKVALKGKELSCTIEARTPVPDRYTTAPPATAYMFANDYPSIGRACDSVKLMTYDQQTADQKLNALRTGPYFPVADTLWTEKVVNLAAQDIPKSKISIGVATYGRELAVTVTPQGKYSYKNLWSFNPGYADEVEDDYDIAPARNAWGEMSLAFVDRETKGVSQRTLIKKAPKGTPEGLQVAYGAREYAKETGQPVTFNLLSWSDAGALSGHIALAKRLGVAGVAIFKIDGGEDKGTWRALR